MLNLPTRKGQPNQRSKAIASVILGIDEVGRGPWAGPLVVGAVILGEHWCKPTTTTTDGEQLLSYWQELTDSKKLTAKKRQKLNKVIREQALAAGLGWVSASEIDRCGLTASLKLATRRAVKRILAQKVSFDEIIIDGTVNFLTDTPLEEKTTMLKKGDSLIKEISAASIVAKVARDEYMTKLATKYPEYGFEKHVGYGTALHKKSLENYGVTPEHRQSFRPIRNLIIQNSARANEHKSQNLLQPAKDDSRGAPQVVKHDSPNESAIQEGKQRLDLPSTTANADHETHHSIRSKSILNATAKGQNAENIVANFLELLGHVILAHNFKTKSYEIDLISIKDQEIYFTEVKYRKNNDHGSALDQITPAKRKQMTYAAEKFLGTQFDTLQECLAQGFEFDQQLYYSKLSTPQLTQSPTKLQPLLAVATVSGANYEFEDWFVIQ